MAKFITHPWDASRVGDVLAAGLQDPKWIEFRAAVAWARRSGTQYIAPYLSAFARRAGTTVNISIGVDFGGSTYEGAKQLVDAVAGFGKLWVYQNTSNTFHPKVFWFRNASSVDVIVGSGNLTKGGLYENSESFIRHILDLSKADDAALAKSIEVALDRWSVYTANLCLPLDHAVLDELRDSGDLPSEATAKGAIKAAMGAIAAAAKTKSPFKSFAVAKAPAAPAAAATPLAPAPAAPGPPAKAAAPPVPAAPVPPVPVAVAAPPVAVVAKGPIFGMTLQNTDVGVGQTGFATQRRSPEVFIPLEALDQLPTFWNWKTRFQPTASYKADPGWRAARAAWIAEQLARPNRIPRPVDKLDWSNVQVKLKGHAGLLTATIWFNPYKKDIRIRQEDIRSAGDVGDILLMRRAPPGSGYDFDMEVIKKAHPAFPATEAKLTTQIRNSAKRIGYF